MPTNPVNPLSSAAVDRLALNVSDARGVQSGPSSVDFWLTCFDAEASAVIFGCFGAACFEAEASSIAACSCSSWCFQGE